MKDSEINKLYQLLNDPKFNIGTVSQELYCNNIIFEDIKYWDMIFPIEPEIILNAINNNAYYFFDNNTNIVNEKQQQTYLTQFLEDAEIQTKNFNYNVLYPQDINKIFNNFTNENFFNLVPVYIQFFDFSNIEEKLKIFKACSNLNNINFALKLYLNKNANGCCVDLRKFNKKLVFLFFNTLSYTRRTIYHEWTHYLQKTCGSNFEYIIKHNISTSKNIDKQLQKFHINRETLINYFFKPTQYPTQIDNLIYAIKQTWKKYYSINMSKSDFCQLVIKTFKTKDIAIFNSKLYNDFKNTSNTFEMSIKFLIFTYICYQNTEYLDLIRILQEHF